MQNSKTYDTRYKNSSGKNETPPSIERIRLSIPKQSKNMLSIAHNASSIGITFNTTSIILYARLLTLATVTVSSSTCKIASCRGRRLCALNSIRWSWWFIFLCHHLPFLNVQSLFLHILFPSSRRVCVYRLHRSHYRWIRISFASNPA